MSNAYSTVGKVRLTLYGTLYLANILVLALSARVNQFQDFFFMADLFPLGLSITTLVILTVLLSMDFSSVNSVTARPPFEIGLLSLLTIFWLAFNSFSTVRWSHIPLACSNIPADFADERTWCGDVQALKAFVWIEWVILLVTLAATTRYVAIQHNLGNTHIWKTALSRYEPYSARRNSAFPGNEKHHRGSSFWAGESFARFSAI